MDETSLRAQLELAVSAEPPLGPIVSNSVRAGRTRRRRRRAAGAASLSAAAVVLVGAIPALTAGADHQADRSRPDATRHQASRSRPDATRHLASRSRPAPAEQPAEASTAYVAIGSEVVPISLATNTLGTPIRVPEMVGDGPFVTNAAASANGRTIYEVGESAARNVVSVTPIDTATNTAGPTITIKGANDPQGFVVAPNGETAYLSAPGGLFRISTATNTVSKAPECKSFYGQQRWRNGDCWPMAFTPNGKTLYVCTDTTPRNGGRIVTAIPTDGDAPPTRIRLPLAGNEPGFPYFIAITPTGKTAYVLDEVAGAKPGLTTVVPINVATNTPLAPIKIPAPGTTEGLVIAPDGRTAYVLSSRAVTFINTATNRVEATINLPVSPANAYYMVIAPNGKRLYVISTNGVVPISTAKALVLPTIKVPGLYAYSVIAITPNGRTIYVGVAPKHRRLGRFTMEVPTSAGVVPINTATGTVGRFIYLGAEPDAISFAP